MNTPHHGNMPVCASCIYQTRTGSCVGRGAGFGEGFKYDSECKAFRKCVDERPFDLRSKEAA